MSSSDTRNYPTLTLIPVALPAACLFLFKASVSRHVTSSSGKRLPRSQRPKSEAQNDDSIQRPSSLPESMVKTDRGGFGVALNMS